MTATPPSQALIPASARQSATSTPSGELPAPSATKGPEVMPSPSPAAHETLREEDRSGNRRRPSTARAILVPGRNCWRIERADRFAFLVDAAAYYDALAASLERVERSVLVVGWDLHTKAVLQPDDRGRGTDLGARFRQLVKQKPQLRIHLLEWDFSVLFALERDWTPVLGRLGGFDSSRVQFRFDEQHPLFASQHQKIVLLDDTMAYVGGIDLTVHRWDTPEHRVGDPRRRLPSGRRYGPFHDVQVALDGPAAEALGQLAKERWESATKQTLPTSTDRGPVPWPHLVVPHLENVDVAIARTCPSAEGDDGIYEIKQLYLDAIAAARDIIYIENQYFTASCITDALERRLREEDGPQVVLVLPERCPGWLEQSTMGVLRRQQLRRLIDADQFDRFRAVAPYVSNGDTRVSVTVHSKVLVIDERLVRVGSSNLSRRSMGFDSECDVAIEAKDGAEATAQAIRSFRNRLIAEHLGLDEEDVERHLREHGSLISLVDSAPESKRGVSAIDLGGEGDALVLDAELVDPLGPEAPGKVVQQFFNDDVAGTSRHPWVKATLAIAVLLGLAAVWKWTPLKEWVEPERMLSLARSLGEHQFGPIIVLAAFALGGLLMVPLTALLMATALTFGFWEATLYSLLGATLGGAAGFGLGDKLGSATIRRLMGSRLRRVSEVLGRRGILTVIGVRLVPIAPFTIANMILGASHVKLRDFVIGSAIALLPGIVAINLFETNLHAAIANPTWGKVLLVGTIPVGAVLLLALLRRGLENASRNGQ